MNMKWHYRLSSIIVLAVLILSCSSTKEKGKSGKVTIIYSGNIGARYDPCGCRIPLGGLARRSTLINGIKSADSDVLVLDTGALIFERHRLYPPYESVSRMSAHLVVDMVNKIGMDAGNVSAMDLADGPDSLIAYAKLSSWPWLSANVVKRGTGERLFTPDVMKTVGSLQIGIFGFMDQTSIGVPFFDDNAPVQVLDPVETARSEVDKLRKAGADLVIALAYMDKDNVERLLNTVPGINLLIFGHTKEHNPSSDQTFFMAYKVKDTIVARCPDGGRVLGVMRIEMWNGSTQFEDGTMSTDLRPEAVREAEKPENKKSFFTNVFVNLEPSIKRDRAIQDELDKVGAVIDSLREELRIESEKK